MEDMGRGTRAWPWMGFGWVNLVVDKGISN